MPTVIDQSSRESPLIEVDFSMSGLKVAAALDRRIADGAVPISLTVEHATEFTSKALKEWSRQRDIKLDFTQSGTPRNNGHIYSFNGRLPNECLNVNQFVAVENAKGKSKLGGLNKMGSRDMAFSET